VASDVADNAILLPHGRAGFLFPSGDVDALVEYISRLLTDRPLRVALGQAARDWVTDAFSTEALARRTANVFLELLDSSGPVNTAA